MNFDLLDDAMLNDGFVSDMNFDFQGGSLMLDDIDAIPIPDDNEQSAAPLQEQPKRGIKRGHSWDDLVRCVSDQSDGDITKDERDELQDFLKEVGIDESPTPSPDTFECWGATISPVSEEPKVEPVGHMPFAFEPAPRGPWQHMMPPPDKRMRMQMPPYPPVYPVTPPAAPHGQVVPMPLKMPNLPPVASPPAPRKGRDNNKNRTTRQFVPFEEMQRLMAEYGPIKTPRKRKNNNSLNEDGTGGTAKMESIKRKFYRWFPDFEERFIKNNDGMTYRPKAGHEKEVAYRLAMRNRDQEILVHKRKIGRKCEY